jgi:hypothetical protein
VRRASALLGLVALVSTLTACRLDTLVTVDVRPNGSGEVAVSVTADPALVAAVPDLTERLELDDLVAAGWTVEAPAPTDAGGLRMRISRRVDTVEDLVATLDDLSAEFGPLKDLSLDREGKVDDSTWTLRGRLEVNGGLSAFADEGLLAVIGAPPFSDAVGERGLELGQALGLTLRVRLPGDLVTTTGVTEGDVTQWTATFDGGTQEIVAVSQHTAVGATVGRVVAPVLGWLLGVWLVAMAALSVAVAVARRRRRPATPAS